MLHFRDSNLERMGRIASLIETRVAARETSDDIRRCRDSLTGVKALA